MGACESKCCGAGPGASDRPHDVNKDNSDDSLGHKFRAISVHYLCTQVFKEMEMNDLKRDSEVYHIEPLVIRPKGVNTICPRDGRMGAAYVDCVHGRDNVGIAKFMLSYTWGYQLGDIADTLVHYCEGNGISVKETYVWMCWACINQHRVKEAKAAGLKIPFESFKAEFGERVTGIKHILAMLAPWSKPVYITRVWCVFELYTAATSTGVDGKKSVDLTIVMPPQEHKEFRHAVFEHDHERVHDPHGEHEDGEEHDVEMKRTSTQIAHSESYADLHCGGVDTMWKVLANVSVEDAQASVPTDKEQILKLIEEGPGFKEINSQVAKLIQNWMVDNSKVYLQHIVDRHSVHALELTTDENRKIVEKTSALACKVGDLFSSLGRVDEAHSALMTGKHLYERLGHMKTEKGAQLLRDLGALLSRKRDWKPCLEFLEASKRLREEIGTLVSNEGAKVLLSLAVTKRDMKDLKGSIADFEQAITIRKQLNSFDSPDGANLLSSKGVVKSMQGDHEGALAAYHEALGIREKCDQMIRIDGGKLLTNIGRVKCYMGDYKGGLTSYWQAHDIFAKTGTLNTRPGKDLVHQLQEHEREGSAEMGVRAAWSLRQEYLGQGHCVSDNPARTQSDVMKHLQSVKSRTSEFDVPFQVEL